MRDFTREIKKLKLKKGLECAECIRLRKFYILKLLSGINLLLMWKKNKSYDIMYQLSLERKKYNEYKKEKTQSHT